MKCKESPFVTRGEARPSKKIPFTSRKPASVALPNPLSRHFIPETVSRASPPISRNRRHRGKRLHTLVCACLCAGVTSNDISLRNRRSLLEFDDEFADLSMLDIALFLNIVPKFRGWRRWKEKTAGRSILVYT